MTDTSGRIRVLLVDDSAHDRALIRDALERESTGFAVIEAPDREAFERALSEGGFDFVVTDFNILGYDGLEVLRVIRERYPDLPVVLVTGTGSEEIAVEALRQGADDYVMKNVRHIRRLPHTIRSVLEARQTAARLRRRDADIRAIVENTSDAILVVDGAGRVQFANLAAEALFGASAGELVGADLSELAGGEEEGRVELPRRQGGPGWGEVHRTAITWDGQPCRLVTVRDVTERVRQEQEKRGLEERLAEAARMEAIGRLAAGIAHDFNNLLFVIRGHADLLGRRLAGDGATARHVEAIREAAETAAGLTGQLLAFARRQVMQPQVLDLNAEIAAVSDMLRRLIGEDVTLEIVPAPDLGAVRMDRNQFRQVLMNLAANARDAMPSGGTLTIQTANVELDEAGAAACPGATPGPHVLVQVSDTGVGMDAGTLACIFEPFFTTKEHTRRSGTGLGLSAVHGIVSQSGGHIVVESAPGRGSTFRIYLPRVGELPPARKEARRAPSAASGGETILLVDDDPTVRRLLRSALEGAGYAVLEAEDGEDGLRVAAAHPGRIDLVLTDAVMPRLSGAGMVRALGQTRPGMRVIYMSGYTEAGIARRGALPAGVDFLQKPCPIDTLLEKVRSVLDAEEPGG